MEEQRDYVIVKNARMIGEKSLSHSLQGVFIGTHKYFFFIPENTTEDIRRAKNKKMLEPTFLYKGRQVGKVLDEIINKREASVASLEEFILKRLKKEIKETMACSIDDIAQFKVYTTWWGSGVLVNQKEGQTGWKNLVSRFKSAKKKVKQFYKEHSKMLN